MLKMELTFEYTIKSSRTWDPWMSFINKEDRFLKYSGGGKPGQLDHPHSVSVDHLDPDSVAFSGRPDRISSDYLNPPYFRRLLPATAVFYGYLRCKFSGHATVLFPATEALLFYLGRNHSDLETPPAAVHLGYRRRIPTTTVFLGYLCRK
ncbi:hypothetical protein L6452_11004 [Arctium lappa]|uniref:Uncharacterized protein n=1 Tax=Arctium lappa TaxID=4217 RepID=A0ACB9DN43_ARCLA|nr:hypothetical protein L6452_11004 [Arctium lappa]